MFVKITYHIMKGIFSIVYAGAHRILIDPLVQVRLLLRIIPFYFFERTIDMNTVKTILKTAGSFITKNSPTIMTGLATAGVISTSAFVATATKKAVNRVDAENQARGEDTPKVDKKDAIKLCWKYYIPAAVMGSLTIACIIGANSVNLKRNAALAGLYSLSEASLKEYQEKVAETIGEKKEELIRGKINEEVIKQHPASDGQNAIIIGDGDVLCYDVMSGRYLTSTVNDLQRAENYINRTALSDGFVSLNEFYEEIGLGDIYLGQEIGWTPECPLQLKFTSNLTDKNQPCLVINYCKTARRD